MSNTPRNVAQTTCIFCGKGGTPGNPISPEHLWSDWMATILSSLLPKDNVPEHVESHERAPRGSIFSPREIRSVRGLVHRKKTIKAVCQHCNHGWMSIVEAATKSRLIPLMQGESILLDWYARQMLTDWIVMKLFVAEFNATTQSPPDPVFSGRDREYFMGWRLIPPNIQIWLMKHSSPLKWRSGIFRDSSGLFPAGVPLPPPPPPKNAQSVTFGIGHLLIHLTATTSPALYPSLNTLGIGPRYRLLWPISDTNIWWPPLVTISQAEADWIAMDLDRIVNGPTTTHID